MSASVMARFARPVVARSVLLVCDIQETFRERIHDFSSVVRATQLLCGVSRSLDIPILATEQNPLRLKPIVVELATHLCEQNVFPKMLFSMMTPELQARVASLRPDAESFIICGIEAHVCVLQTTLDLLRSGKRVFVVIDGVSSQRQGDRSIALRTMEQAGARLTTTESLTFELLEIASNPCFKEVQKQIIEYVKNPSTLDHL